MPSILVELGFITNSKDEGVIASKEGQKKLARGIFEGFSNFYSTYHNGAKLESIYSNDVVIKEESAAAKAKPAEGKPVFKVQILTSGKKLTGNDRRLKGVKAEYYKENGTYKYTYGASEDYNIIVKKRNEISKKFKEAFIVAFLNGKRINTQEAIRIFKNSR